MLEFLIAAAAGAAATVAEQSLTGISNGPRVIVAAVIVIPFALVYFWLQHRARKAADSPAPAPRRQRYGRSGQQGRRG